MLMRHCCYLAAHCCLKKLMGQIVCCYILNDNAGMVGKRTGPGRKISEFYLPLSSIIPECSSASPMRQNPISLCNNQGCYCFKAPSMKAPLTMHAWGKSFFNEYPDKMQLRWCMEVENIQVVQTTHSHINRWFTNSIDLLINIEIICPIVWLMSKSFKSKVIVLEDYAYCIITFNENNNPLSNDQEKGGPWMQTWIDTTLINTTLPCGEKKNLGGSNHLLYGASCASIAR